VTLPSGTDAIVFRTARSAGIGRCLPDGDGLNRKRNG